MKKIVIKGTRTEVIEAMKEEGYKMEGFNDESIRAGHFYAYKKGYQGADYYTIDISAEDIYTLTQY